VFTSTRRVRFREMEYALPRESLLDAVRAVRRLIERSRWRISFPIEVRVTAADDIWLSTAYGRESGYIAVHQYFRTPYAEYFGAVEEVLTELGGRPHWGKLHTLTADGLAPRYPRFADFVALRDRLDPGRLFANRYLDRVLGA
jgi:L-gulono-1,4-lactone dehydrogenase